ncbi:MAG: blaI 10 [Schlesneria sp.]|jgi:BlaI family penicillinase repressor|nr:blaI 10 [Schlesneria sp.]
MAKKKAVVAEPAEFELQVLGTLWEHGPGTVRQVMERLSDGKERAYTSVLSVMQVMQKKGLLEVAVERDGLAHIFKPLVSRKQVAVPLLRGLVTKIFGGSTKTAMQHLLAETVDRDEINEMRKLLDEIERGKKNP